MWDLMHDSGQHKLIYSSQNHCTLHYSIGFRSSAMISFASVAAWISSTVNSGLYSFNTIPSGVTSVSYTHLDVYKRQVLFCFWWKTDFRFRSSRRRRHIWLKKDIRETNSAKWSDRHSRPVQTASRYWLSAWIKIKNSRKSSFQKKLSLIHI